MFAEAIAAVNRTVATGLERDHGVLLLPMLEAVYVDTREEKRVVAIRPKAPFRPVFLVASTREGSDVVLVKDPPPAPPPEADPSTLCFWWRRGGVELHLKRKLPVLVAA